MDDPESLHRRRRRFVEHCMDSGITRQTPLVQRSGVAQSTISRIMHGNRSVARPYHHAVLLALNELRRERNLSDIAFDEVIWTW